VLHVIWTGKELPTSRRKVVLSNSGIGGTRMILVLIQLKINIHLFYILVTLRLGIILVNNQLDAQFLLYIFISILYVFRATLCSSSGESIVSIQRLVYVTLCRWPSGMQVGLFIRIRNNTLLYSKHRSQFTNWQTVELKGLGVAQPARRVSRARF